jgi:hypothetical protein
MAWSPDYCSASELKAHLRVSDSADDAEIGIVISAASRAIDHAAGRQFGNASQTRVYAWRGECAEGRPAVGIDDVMTTVGLTVKLDTDNDGSFATTLTLGTDFDMWPANAPADGEPWTHLKFLPGGVLPDYPVQVAGTFGWTAVPTIVKNACLIQAARFFVRRDASFGVAGSPELGSETRLLERLDPDVAVMIAAVRKWWGAA